MAQAFTPGLSIRRSATVKRVRELPVPDEIVVKSGDLVTAKQVVARAFLPGELHILRVAEKLGIEPFEVMKGLKVKIGERVKEKQIICEHAGLFGLFKSRFESPVEGSIELITERTGHIALRVDPKPIEVNAYLDGRVVSVDPKKALTISTTGAFIQGIFGVGGERQGAILVLPGGEGVCNDASIPEHVAGKILVTRGQPTLSAVKLAQTRGAVGFVTGSIDDRVLAGYLGFDLGIALTGDEEVSMSIILTEGFGSIPMSPRTFELLSEFQGKQASINGATQVRAGALRPEIIISTGELSDARSVQSEAGQGLTLGCAIRIIRVPFFGAYATVHELPQQMQKIETGAFARVLKAKLESGDIVTVPRANVELVT